MGQARNWTQAELDQLAEQWGQKSIGAIAKGLNRSEAAILIKASKLRLGPHIESSDRVSLNVLFQELGMIGGYTWGLKKLKDAGMKIYTHKVKNNSFRMVDIDEFWQFAEKNRHLFDFSRLTENALGAEPEWVKAKRSEDFKRAQRIKPNNTPWTEAEDRELLRLLRAYRYTWPEIAARLHRTEGAIQRRVSFLGVKERPLKADNHTLWTEEQFRLLGEMVKAGSSYENMSEVLGKSVKAIRGRVYDMYLTENLGKVSKMLGAGQWGDNRPERTIAQYKLMTIAEKEQVKETAGRLAGLLTYQIRKQFDNQDNWQRNLCRHWDKVRGCTVGGVNCDDCTDFERIRPQNCKRCGVTFYERHENLFCENCRTQRKKQAARKYLRARQKATGGHHNGI